VKETKRVRAKMNEEKRESEGRRNEKGRARDN